MPVVVPVVVVVGDVVTVVVVGVVVVVSVVVCVVVGVVVCVDVAVVVVVGVVVGVVRLQPTRDPSRWAMMASLTTSVTEVQSRPAPASTYPSNVHVTATGRPADCGIDSVMALILCANQGQPAPAESAPARQDKSTESSPS